ncbi:hypothetical protein [Nocardia sp. NPDC006630]|uniref:hypothetical protein n=1 Tax=Nocardia sp. NPDC006630 TaxID=3157181 RepID=UPI0033ABF545
MPLREYERPTGHGNRLHRTLPPAPPTALGNVLTLDPAITELGGDVPRTGRVVADRAFAEVVQDLLHL